MAKATGRPTAPLVLRSDERDYLDGRCADVVSHDPCLNGAGSSCDVAMACPARSSQSSWACTNIPWGKQIRRPHPLVPQALLPESRTDLMWRTLDSRD